MVARVIAKVTPPEIEEGITPDSIWKGNTFSKPSFLGIRLEFPGCSHSKHLRWLACIIYWGHELFWTIRRVSQTWSQEVPYKYQRNLHSRKRP